MSNVRDTQPPVWVTNPSTAEGTCRFCDHPIEFYDEVGWVDTTAAFSGGSYDMCAQARSGQHEPS